MNYAKIAPQLWTDPVLEEASPQVKLAAAIWLMTNFRTSPAGFVDHPSKRRFEFETGSPYEALTKLLELHPKGFVRTPKEIWIRRFIAHQFGTGMS